MDRQTCDKLRKKLGGTIMTALLFLGIGGLFAPIYGLYLGFDVFWALETLVYVFAIALGGGVFMALLELTLMAIGLEKIDDE